MDDKKKKSIKQCLEILRQLNIKETALKLQGQITKFRKKQKLHWFCSTFPYVIMCWFFQQKYFVVQVRGYQLKEQVFIILFSLHWSLCALLVHLLHVTQTFAMKTELFMDFAIIFLTAESTVSIFTRPEEAHCVKPAKVSHLAKFLIALLIVLTNKSLAIAELMAAIHHAY